MATVTDVARLAEVSPGVVSRLLNGDATLRIRPETRERVLAAARELEYTPNAAARALRNSKAKALGLAVHDVSNPIYAEILAGTQEAAARAGYTVMLADVDALANDDAAFRRFMASGTIDGLLLQRAGDGGDDLVSRVASQHVPTVLLNDQTTQGVSSIAVDDEAGTALATAHLVSLGHRRVGLLQVDGPSNRVDRRLHGWQSALRAAGLEAPDELVALGGHTPAQGERGVRALLGGDDRPTAIVAANSLAAVGALASARAAGIRVPDDLSIVGLHDFEFARHLSTPLDTVRLPLRAMGAAAVSMLLDETSSITRHVMVTSPAPELVLRGSSASPR